MVVLGPVLFRGFEVPERIALGGRQRLAVHRLPGGVRVVDALGGDDAEIGWTGVMAGPDAAGRVRLLDGLRQGGQQWPLAWDGWRYTVVVSKFEAATSGPFWAPYRIRCTVVCEGEPSIIEAVLAVGALLDPGIDARMAEAGAGLDAPGLPEVLASAGALAQLAQLRVFGNIS